MSKRSFYILFISIGLLLSGCSSSVNEKNNSVKLVDANAEIQSLYSNRCLNCHAIDLSGVMGEKTNLQFVHERLSKEEIADVIIHGREMMPSFEERLTAEEIQSIAGWLSKQ